MRDSYLVFRDTLRVIDASWSRLSRDIRTGTGALLLSRNRAVRTACLSSLRRIDVTRQNLLGVPMANRAPQRVRTELEKRLTELRPALTRCETEFEQFSDPAKSTGVRDVGATSVPNALAASRKFELAAEAFLSSLGIKVRPFASGDSNPFAGRAN